MDFKFIDWKLVAALGGAVSMVILVTKITPGAAERVLTHTVDAGTALMSASNRGH